MSNNRDRIAKAFSELSRRAITTTSRDTAIAVEIGASICDQLARIADALEDQAQTIECDEPIIRPEDVARAGNELKAQAEESMTGRQRRLERITAELEQEKASRERVLARARETLHDWAKSKKWDGGEEQAKLFTEFETLPRNLALTGAFGAHQLNLWAERLALSPKLFDHLMTRISEIETAKRKGLGS